MALSSAHSFLIRPGHNQDPLPQIRGTRVRKSTEMWENLVGLYDRAGEECTLDIQFARASDGKQANLRRNQLVEYVNDPTMDRGKVIASALCAVTTKRSGMGLLFLLVGVAPDGFVIARFPASEGVVAQESHNNKLEVNFIKEVFMKNLHAYKSVMYSSPAVDHSFWQGKAIDKQLNDKGKSSNYWIEDFLLSELLLTPAQGSRRFAKVMRGAIHNAPTLHVQTELMTFSQGVRGQDGRVISPSELAVQANLSAEAIEAINHTFGRGDLFSEAFRFDKEEFDRYVGFRMVALDNGARMIASDEDFNKIFEQEELSDGRRRFSTRGRVVKSELVKNDLPRIL